MLDLATMFSSEHALDKHFCTSLRKRTPVMTAITRICIVDVEELNRQTETGKVVYNLEAATCMILGQTNKPQIIRVPSWTNKRYPLLSENQRSTYK